MAQYLYDPKSTIYVTSDNFAGSERTASGDYVPAIPQISLTAVFSGEWESTASMNEDLKVCVQKLIAAYQKHVSSRNNQCGNN